MKDKNVAGILALFFGWLGIHRFYLGQIGLGILYLFFFWISWAIGLIDAIAFFAMDTEEFDHKYNRPQVPASFRQERSYSGTPAQRQQRREQRDYRREQRPQKRAYQAPAPPRSNPLKISGIQKFKDFDYEGAIADFEKALEIDPRDVAIHFNLACAFSLQENVEKAFYHLDKAVANGFDDFKRIKEHDALAYLRIQGQFEAFEANGFRLSPPLPKLEPPAENLLDSTPSDLLAQLNRLGELREKGLLTEEEFAAQKKKLLG